MVVVSLHRVFRYFEAILRKYANHRNVDKVEILPDGSYRAVMQPKFEVFPVSDSPFARADGAEHRDVKPPAARLHVGLNAVDLSAGFGHSY